MARKTCELLPMEYDLVKAAAIALHTDNTEAHYDKLAAAWQIVADRLGCDVESIELIAGQASSTITAEIPDAPTS